jgi:hypothetical protein
MVWVRPNASSARLEVKPPFVEPGVATRKGNSPHPSDRTFDQGYTHTFPPTTQNCTRTMSDLTHIPPSPTETFRPKVTLRYASAVGIQAAGVGAVVSAVQNALGSHNYGAAGVLTRTGGTIGFFGASFSLPTPPLPFCIYPWAERNWNHSIYWVLGMLELGVNRCYGCYVRSDGIGGG